jgi:TonB family protein
MALPGIAERRSGDAMKLRVGAKRRRDDPGSSRIGTVTAAMIAGGRIAPLVERRRGMRSWQVIGSLLLHLLVLALVVLSVRPRRHPNQFVPPAQVAMVFENGGVPHPAAPKAQRLGPPERAHLAPPPAALSPVPPRVVARAAPPPVLQAVPPLGGVARAVPSPPAVVQTAPPAVQTAPAAPHPLASVPAPRAAAQPKVARAVQPAPERVARAAPPPPVLQAVAPPVVPARPVVPAQPSEQQYSVRLSQSELQAFLQPPSVPAPLPFVPAPLPVPPTPPRTVPPAPPAPPAQRYLVMNNMSYGGPPQGAAASPAPQSGRLNLALNQSVMRNAFAREFSIHGDIGPDWEAALSQWVNERKYYPEPALEMDQQGSVAIRLVVARDGSVLNVTLLQSSGSPFLDQAWLGMFRGARVPPFPPGTPSNEITLEATMHYILVND